MINNMYPCGTGDVCTGCGACAAGCPENCIAMLPNAEGFLEPVTDAAACTNCGICRTICPVNPESDAFESNLHAGEKEVGVYAAWHLDEQIRRASSSGGVFTALAESVLCRGGVVVGAAFDDQFAVRHIIIESPDQLSRLRGSKYVQSETCPALYHQIRDLLQQGRAVLFSGTPCQVAGLRCFLRRPYDNLYCCDLICHGVPSPFLFRRYAENTLLRGFPLTHINFRDKKIGWKTFGVRQYFQDGSSRWFSMWADIYMAAFLRNYTLRPACYACRFTSIFRHGDLTIADFWGVGRKYPEYDLDNRGTSLILINNEHGKAWFESCRSNLFVGAADLETAVSGNPMLTRSSERPPQRDTFYADLEILSFKSLVRKYHIRPPSLLRRMSSQIKRKIITRVVGIRKD